MFQEPAKADVVMLVVEKLTLLFPR